MSLSFERTQSVAIIGGGPGGYEAALAPERRGPRRFILAIGSLLVAVAAVIIALLLVQGGADKQTAGQISQSGGGAAQEQAATSEQRPSQPPDQNRNGNGGDRGGAQDAEGPSNARLIREPSFTLAIPPAWKRSNPPRGATFAAEAADGTADAALWVERNRDLSLREFETDSLRRLKRVARNVRVESRIPAPTDAGTVIRLRADAPAGGGGRTDYEVTLHAAGPFRYYLVTSTEPGAPRAVRGAVRLVHGSFIPEPQNAKKKVE